MQPPAAQSQFTGRLRDVALALREDPDDHLLLDVFRFLPDELLDAPSVAVARGGLADLVWSFRPAATPRPVRHADIPTTSTESAALARALRAEGFAFVGPTTMYALMEAIGMVDTHLAGSHRRGTSGVCPQG